MVATRSQTNTLNKNFSNLFIQKKGQPSPKRGAKRPAKSPTSSRSPIHKAALKSPAGQRKSTKKEETSQPSECANCMSMELCDGHTFPSRAWGEKETVGLSKIGRADKEVEIWEAVYNAHATNEPHLLPIVERSLQQAREARAALDETLEENLRVG